MKKFNPDINPTQIWVSDMVLPLHKCIVIASNMNYVVITNAALIQEFILGHASHFRKHTWTVSSTL